MADLKTDAILREVCERGEVAPDVAAHVLGLTLDSIREHLLRGDQVDLEDFLRIQMVREPAKVVGDEDGRYRKIVPARHVLSIVPAGRLGEMVERSRIARVLFAAAKKDRFSEMFVEHFRKVGWTVDVVESGREFEERLREHAAYLTVIDSGFEEWRPCVENLKLDRRTNGVPVIVIHKRGVDPTRPDALSIRSDVDIVEPFDVHEFLKIADAALARHAEELAIFEHQASFVFPTRASEIERCYGVLERLFLSAGFGEEDGEALMAAAREAIQNAASHGNGDDESRNIVVEYLLDNEKATLVVRDEGDGFDHRSYVESGKGREALDALRQRIQQGLKGGLGLVLMLRCVDRVEFNDSGNEVVLTKRRGGPRKAVAAHTAAEAVG